MGPSRLRHRMNPSSTTEKCAADALPFAGCGWPIATTGPDRRPCFGQAAPTPSLQGQPPRSSPLARQGLRRSGLDRGRLDRVSFGRSPNNPAY